MDTEAKREEYRRALALFDAMNQVRRVWGALQPPPPMRRGDVMLLGLLLEHENTHKEPLTTGQLARMMKHSPPSVSQKLAPLEEQGLITRRAPKADRRVSFIRLTAKGRREAGHALDNMLCAMEDAMNRMGDEKADAMVGLLHQFSQAMQATLAAGPDAHDATKGGKQP